MKIKALSLLIAICMVIGMFPAVIAAENSSGTWGGNLSWRFSDGVLTISGEGAMETAKAPEDSCVREYPWSYLPFTKLVIEEGVTTIGDGAFAYMEHLETVSLPQSLEALGYETFFFSENLTGPVVIPQKVTRIPGDCFRYCLSLEEVVLHDGITSLGWYCFADSGLKRVYIPAGVSDIDENYCFDYCDDLERFTVSKDNPYFASDDQGALYNKDMTRLMQVPAAFSGKFVIPEGVLYADSHPYAITESAFDGCEGITEIYVPASLEQLFGYSLVSPVLTAVHVAQGNPNMYDMDGILYGYQNEDPENGRGDMLTLVKIPAAKQIGDFTVAEDVQCVGSDAFHGCRYVDEVTIHADCVVFLSAFDSSSVKAIWFEEGHRLYISDEEGVVFNQDMTKREYDYDLGEVVETFYPAGTALMCFPKGRTGFYRIPEGVMRLARNSFEYSAVEALRFPSTLTKIEDYILANCPELSWMLFAGEKPAYDAWYHEAEELTVYYPGWLESWAEPEIFGEDYTYIPYEQGEEPVWEDESENTFTDVPAGSFYAAPVAWAVEKGITNGTTENSFSPDGECLRAQVVAFLWRAEGCPEPKSLSNPFVDVKESAFYFKAVLWAVEEGITNGSDATHFNPSGVCSRAQVVTFLHRAKGAPAPASMDLPFTDVPAGTWYAAPIAWAVENGITNGLSATAFGPDATCNRAQVVTFLYRAYVPA